jgi:hypothetical protein
MQIKNKNYINAWNKVFVGVAVLFIICFNCDFYRESLGDSMLDGKSSSKLMVLKTISSNSLAWMNVSNWLIEYEAVPSKLGGEFLPVHKIVAASKPNEFFFLGAHFPAYPWQVDPFAQAYYIKDGRTYHVWPFNRAYSEGTIHRGDSIPGTVVSELMMAVIPLWPLTDYDLKTEEVSGNIALPNEAINSEDYLLLTNTENICDENCVIFDHKGMDRIWIAPDKGVCVMKREFRNATGELLERISVKSLQEFKPGMWFPLQMTNQFFRSSPTNDERILAEEFHVQTIRCIFNSDVKDSVYFPCFSSGELKYTNSIAYEQVSPGGEDLLLQIVSFCKTYAHLPTKPAHAYKGIILFMASFIAGLSGTLFLLSGKRYGQ